MAPVSRMYGSGRGKLEGKLSPKNCSSWEIKRNKIWKFCKFYCRGILLSFRRLPLSLEIQSMSLRVALLKSPEEKIKGRFCRRVVLANVPLCRFFAPSLRFLYPRSGFWCRRSVFCTLVPVLGGLQREHPPTTLWKPPFSLTLQSLLFC